MEGYFYEVNLTTGQMWRPAAGGEPWLETVIQQWAPHHYC